MLCVNRNTDGNKFGVPHNTFAHNQGFCNHQSLLTDRVRASSLACGVRGLEKLE